MGLDSELLRDSIQTVHTQEDEGIPGSITQVRQSAQRLMSWAKSSGVTVFVTGHFTKEGAIAGPRVLEHIVDVVLYLEGEQFSAYRLLRCVKNRFGSTNEIGVFEMKEKGLIEVENPSLAFLSQRQDEAVGRSPGPAKSRLVEVTKRNPQRPPQHCRHNNRKTRRKTVGLLALRQGELK
jgi:DNA repair protein RadA/Sms